jgi:hypothetical protein
MQPPASNADCREPLPLFRPEALAARQNLNGSVLTIRAFSLRFLASLAAAVGVLLLACAAFTSCVPTTQVAGAVSDIHSPDSTQIQAVFYVPVKLTRSIQPGSRLALHCSRCSHSVSLSGTVAGVSPATGPAARDASTNLARPEPLCMVTVALSTQNSHLKGQDRLQAGTTLEAEFPLEPRPLLQWLIGTLAT